MYVPIVNEASMNILLVGSVLLVVVDLWLQLSSGRIVNKPYER